MDRLTGIENTGNTKDSIGQHNVNILRYAVVDVEVGLQDQKIQAQ